MLVFCSFYKRKRKRQKLSNIAVKAIEIVYPEGLDLDFPPNRKEPLEVPGPTSH